MQTIYTISTCRKHNYFLKVHLLYLFDFCNCTIRLLRCRCGERESKEVSVPCSTDIGTIHEVWRSCVYNPKHSLSHISCHFLVNRTWNSQNATTVISSRLEENVVLICCKLLSKSCPLQWKSHVEVQSKRLYLNHESTTWTNCIFPLIFVNTCYKLYFF